MTFWATFSIIGNDSCALARPMGSHKATKANREARLIIAVSFLTRRSPQRSLLEHGTLRFHGASTLARTRLMKATSSSSEWKCVTCPETTCSTRPSQANGASGGWARNHITNARLVGSGSGSWGIDDLLQAPGQAGHCRVVRGMPGRYTTRTVQDHRPSVQMWGRGVTEAFTSGARCSSRRGDALVPDLQLTCAAGVKRPPLPRIAICTPL